MAEKNKNHRYNLQTFEKKVYMLFKNNNFT